MDKTQEEKMRELGLELAKDLKSKQATKSFAQEDLLFIVEFSLRNVSR